MRTRLHHRSGRALPGLLAGLLVAGVTMLLMAVAAELAVRWLRPQPPSWLAIYRRHPALPFHALEPEVSASVDTGESRWSVTTDADGFRSLAGSAPGHCEAWWLGDSFVFGHGVDAEQSVVGRVARAAPEVHGVNTGVPGYGPVQYRQVLEDLLGRRPAPRYVFVMTFVGNDFHDTLWDKDVEVHEGVLGHRGDWKSWLKNHLHLYRLATSVYHRYGTQDADPYQGILVELADPDAWQPGGALVEAEAAYRAEMTHMAELAARAGAEIRFVLIPTRDAVRAARGEAWPAGEDPLIPVERARAILEQTGARVLDATPVLAVDAGPVFYPFDGHLTPEGNAHVAEAFLALAPVACPDARAAR